MKIERNVDASILGDDVIEIKYDEKDDKYKPHKQIIFLIYDNILLPAKNLLVFLDYFGYGYWYLNIINKFFWVTIA